ncbi:MAG: glycoside hydrolase family 5 protein [Fibrobacter sp.]|nr:glycoside hydrolase family 5 protein [Fibrobacter sp.]
MKKLIPLMAASAFAVQAWALPTAAEIQKQMGFGINIGNTMEVPISSACPTMECWGNPFPTATYIKDIADAGFGSVRIPAAWYTHADPTTGKINEGWLDSVYTVVKMVVDNGMYAFLNSHWDTGWLEDNVFAGTHSISDDAVAETDSALVNKLQGEFWKQIADKFKDFDEHVIFGSANEPGVNDAWLSSGQVQFTTERMALLNRYHETMINAVRASGGNNATRTIAIQGPRTDEALTLSLLANNMPNDPAGPGYLMMEFHFYPYQFSLMKEDADWGNCFYYWGEENYSTTDIAHNANRQKVISGSDTTYVLNENQYAGPAYTDSVFAAIKTAFVDKGYPVVIGEYAAIKRSQLTGDNLRKHLNSRVSWYKRVNELSKEYGFVPFAWDTGAEGDADNSIILRQKGHSGIYDYNVLNAMRTAYGLPALDGDIIDSLVTASLDQSNRAVQLTYTSVRSDSSEVGTFRLNLNGANWSNYIGVSILAKVDLESSPLDGVTYSWVTVSPFVMSGSAWSWSDYNIETADIVAGSWANYVISFNSTGLDITAKNNVMAFGVNVYGTQLSGTVTIDNILLLKADGTADTLANFNKSVTGDVEGIITDAVLVTPDVPATAVTVGTLGIEKATVARAAKMNVNVQPGLVTAMYTATSAGAGKAMLLNGLGQVISQQNFAGKAGTNSVQLAAGFRGPAFLVVQQGSQKYTARINLK